MHRLKIRGNILFGYLFTFIFSIIFIGAATVIFKNIYAVVLTLFFCLYFMSEKNTEKLCGLLLKNKAQGVYFR